MNRFTEKLLKDGPAPDAQDWMDYLKDAHRREPSMTPAAFGRWPTDLGPTSYALLVEPLKNATQADLGVLDLACGDGFLMRHILPQIGPKARVYGVDMSVGELEVARAQVRDPRVSFFEATAQALPLPDQSVDFVFSHMAFMLMAPIEPVVSELARVLKPGGSFSAVIGSRRFATDFFEQISVLVRQTLREYLPGLKNVNIGDDRIDDVQGWNQLFTKELGFSSEVEMVDFNLLVSLPADELWEFERTTYFVDQLPPAGKEQLKAKITALGRAKADASGQVNFQFPMRLLRVKKDLP